MIEKRIYLNTVLNYTLTSYKYICIYIIVDHHYKLIIFAQNQLDDRGMVRCKNVIFTEIPKTQIKLKEHVETAKNWIDILHLKN